MGKIEFKECKSAFEAMVWIASGMIFFLTKHPYKTIIALLFMLSGPTYIVFDYFSSDRAKIELAKPIGENAIEFSLMPEAIASEGVKGDSILIHGKFYGYADPHVQTWKMLDKPVILLWDKEHDVVLQVQAPIGHEKMLQYKQ